MRRPQISARFSAVAQKSIFAPPATLLSASASGGGEKYGTNFTPRCLTCAGKQLQRENSFSGNTGKQFQPRLRFGVQRTDSANHRNGGKNLKKIRGAGRPAGLQTVDSVEPEEECAPSEKTKKRSLQSETNFKHLSSPLKSPPGGVWTPERGNSNDEGAEKNSSATQTQPHQTT